MKEQKKSWTERANEEFKKQCEEELYPKKFNWKPLRNGAIIAGVIAVGQL